MMQAQPPVEILVLRYQITRRHIPKISYGTFITMRISVITMMQYLNKTFPGRRIGCGSPIHWPPRSPDLTSLDFCLCFWVKGKAYKIKDDTRDEFYSLIVEVAASIKGREDRLRRKTRDIRSRVAKRAEVDGGILEHLL